jgi:hypothetical protein
MNAIKVKALIELDLSMRYDSMWLDYLNMFYFDSGNWLLGWVFRRYSKTVATRLFQGFLMRGKVISGWDAGCQQ